MAHDQNGRVGPPRCGECNAPLSGDEVRLCRECQAVRDAEESYPEDELA